MSILLLYFKSKIPAAHSEPCSQTCSAEPTAGVSGTDGRSRERPGTHGGALLVVVHSEGIHHLLLLESHLHQGNDGLRESPTDHLRPCSQEREEPPEQPSWQTVF